MLVRRFGGGLLIALICLVTKSLYADLRVTPAYVELQVEGGRASGSFVLANTGSEPLRIRATMIHFAPDKDGRIQPAPMDSLSVSRWIKLNPKEFSIGANEERQIRFAVVTPAGLPDGSYTGGIEFQPIAAVDTSGKSSIHAVQVISVPVLLDHGKPTYAWQLIADSTFTGESHLGLRVHTLLVNSGTGRIPQRGEWTLKDATGAVIRTGDTSRLSIFPGTQRYFVTTLPPDTPSGTYTFSIEYTSERDGSKVSGMSQVTVPEKLPDPPVNDRRK